ncbi:hypothetical protein PLESTF_000476300 [Pleodorina starrii]|nr:hypothetical protein PLESTF_000476300 [Pleodorina starrii]
MSAPFSDKANPFTELGSEQPAADNIATSGQQPDVRSGEVLPGDVAGYLVPGAQPVGRSAEQDVAVGSLSEGVESTSVATAANDSPIPATVAATSGAEAEDRARERAQGTAATPATAGGGGRGSGDDEGFQPARGGVAAAERAAEMRGVGVPPTHAGGGGGGEEALRASSGTADQGGGGKGGGASGGGGGRGGVGQAVSSVMRGLAGLVAGEGGRGAPGRGDDTQ